MKKIILGFIGEPNSGRTTAANILKKKGFHIVSLNSKVEEFAKHLFPEGDMEDNREVILGNIRERGCSVHKEYWLNLVLISVPDSKNFIVFDDISMAEASNKKIIAYQIYRPGISTVKLPDIDTIVNDGTIKEFTEKIKDLYKSIV